jgi:hypothetical protein
MTTARPISEMSADEQAQVRLFERHFPEHAPATPVAAEEWLAHVKACGGYKHTSVAGPRGTPLDQPELDVVYAVARLCLAAHPEIYKFTLIVHTEHGRWEYWEEREREERDAVAHFAAEWVSRESGGPEGAEEYHAVLNDDATFEHWRRRRTAWRVSLSHPVRDVADDEALPL